MRLRIALLLVAVSCSSTLPGDVTPIPKRLASLTESSLLRFDGIGPAKVGMTIAEASRAIGRAVSVDPNSSLAAEHNCAHATLVGGPEGLSFLVTRDDMEAEWHIRRVDVAEPAKIASEKGIRIAATEDAVRTAYGDKLGTEGHQYVPAGHYLTVDPDGADGLLLLFETDGKAVTQFRAGDEEWVRAPEGCA